MLAGMCMARLELDTEIWASSPNKIRASTESTDIYYVFLDEIRHDA
jgi:hypothetical protein